MVAGLLLSLDGEVDDDRRPHACFVCISFTPMMVPMWKRLVDNSFV